MTIKSFKEAVSFTRASGATRVNSLGLIVGVDFSSTSNTITTGSKTFTLTADLNVNRDWAVGSSVIAVSQAGATGTMTGTVTSYVPSTQVLVINVTSITGSGTSTDWRIGSLEFRRDFDPVTLQPRGGLVEGGATNRYSFSNDISNAAWTKEGATAINPAISPDGSVNAFTLVESTGTGEHQFRRLGLGAVAGEVHHLVFFVQPAGRSRLRLRTNFWSAATENLDFNFNTDTFTAASRFTVQITSFGSFKRVFVSSICDVSGDRSTGNNFQLRDDAGLATYTGDGVSGMRFWGINLRTGDIDTSVIPTTTVSVTRAADQASVTGANFGQLYNSAQGTMVFEVTPVASAVGAVVGSLNDGTLNNSIRIQQKQTGTLSSIRKMATDGVTDVMAVNASTGNTLRSNGVDYVEVADQSGASKLGAASSGIGNFLNVGATENFRSSADSGLTYNARTIGGTFGGAHFGIGRFIIAGSTSTINGSTVGSVIVSTDGLSFRRVNIPGLTQQLNEVTSNGTNQYVAVGNGGVIYTSPDAETWTARVSGVTQAITGIAFGGGQYVATYALGNAGILTSPDGITWTPRNSQSPNTAQDVAYNGTNLYVAVAGGGDICRSTDGITWTRIAAAGGNTQTLLGVHFADGLWVAVGNAGTVVTSPDGITWTDRTANSGTTSNINEVGFFSSKFYYVGTTSSIVADNTAAGIVDGTTWTIRNAAATSVWQGIATNGSRLLICGSSGAIATSDDGTTFTSRTGNGVTLQGAAFGNGTYVIVGNAANGSGLIATVNPTTFAYQRRVSGVTANVNNVRFLNGAFYACTVGMIRSVDGQSWMSAGTSTLTMLDVAFGNGVFVSTRNAGSGVFVSSDGMSFNTPTVISGFAGGGVNGIDFANGLFTVVGSSGSIATSPNGTTWTIQTSGTTNTLHSVMFSTRDNQWYAAGDNGTILRSADAITWENISNDAATPVFKDGVIQSNGFLPNLVPGQLNKVAVRIQENGIAASVNGSPAIVDSNPSRLELIPSVNRLSIGMNGVSGQHFNGWIKKIRYIPSAVSDASLQQLTA